MVVLLGIVRPDLILPRFLAVILFGIATFVGLPTAAVALGCLFAGNWPVALQMAMAWPIVGMTIWLGKVIWSGRSIPSWFILSLAGLASAVPTATLIVQGEWFGAKAMVGLLAPALMMICAGMRTTYGTSAKSKAIDDELA